VRELQNVIERSVVVSDVGEAAMAHFSLLEDISAADQCRWPGRERITDDNRA
jgi:hypothetical protein